MNDIKISTEKLKKYFYNRFKNADYKTVLLNLYNVEERERIINKLAENQEEAYFYNNIYESTLKNISKIFRNNDEYKKEQAKQKEEELQEQLKKQLDQQQKDNQKIKKYKTLVNIFFIFVNPITITIFLLILGYFKIALPILNS